MTQKFTRAVILGVGLMLGAATAAPVFAQGAGQQTIGGFLGLTDRDDADFTVGVEYEYHLDSMFSVGGILEYTPDAIGSSDATVLMATGNYRPQTMPRLKLTGGVGAEFNTFDDDIRFRIGAGYDVIADPITITPRVALDFGGGDENMILGATFSRRF